MMKKFKMIIIHEELARNVGIKNNIFGCYFSSYLEENDVLTPPKAFFLSIPF